VAERSIDTEKVETPPRRTMIDDEFIREKVNLITRDLERLRVFYRMSFAEVAEDFIKFSALKNILMEIIGRAIDVNEHVIAEMADPEMEIPKTYKETFLRLGKLKALPEGFAQEISRSAGFRNAIVHEYNNLDKGFVYKTVGEAIDQYARYCRHILEFLCLQNPANRIS
jgi:uncharacterized protein YutE (UPF0331/DUF86 family)